MHKLWTIHKLKWFMIRVCLEMIHFGIKPDTLLSLTTHRQYFWTHLPHMWLKSIVDGPKTKVLRIPSVKSILPPPVQIFFLCLLANVMSSYASVLVNIFFCLVTNVFSFLLYPLHSHYLKAHQKYSTLKRILGWSLFSNHVLLYDSFFQPKKYFKFRKCNILS